MVILFKKILIHNDLSNMYFLNQAKEEKENNFLFNYSYKKKSYKTFNIILLSFQPIKTSRLFYIKEYEFLI